MANIDDRSRFARPRVPADPGGAARARAEFSAWLGTHFSLGPERFNDVLLAVNEAIANAAEFAYADSSQRGTLDIDATYDAESDTLAVTVDDRGRWRYQVAHAAGARQELRGRGIPLMQALSDKLVIDRTPRGTRVALSWSDLTGRRSAG